MVSQLSRFLSLFLSLSLYISPSLSLYLSISAYLSPYIPLYLSNLTNKKKTDISISISLSLSIILSQYLSGYLYILIFIPIFVFTHKSALLKLFASFRTYLSCPQTHLFFFPIAFTGFAIILHVCTPRCTKHRYRRPRQARTLRCPRARL